MKQSSRVEKKSPPRIFKQEKILPDDTNHLEFDVDIGIGKKDREKISEGLARLLADTATLYIMTYNFHWNVTGPMFKTLHTMFEEQYKELAEAVDMVAERIRALGFHAPGTYASFARLSSVKEEEGVPTAQRMVKLLVEGQESVVRTARELFPFAEEVHDEPTKDLLTKRMEYHEKTAWMLRSLLH